MPEEPRIPLRYICVKRRPGTEDPPVVAKRRRPWSDYLAWAGLVAIVASLVWCGAWGAYQRLSRMTDADWSNASIMVLVIGSMLALLGLGYFAGKDSR